LAFERFYRSSANWPTPSASRFRSWGRRAILCCALNWRRAASSVIVGAFSPRCDTLRRWVRREVALVTVMRVASRRRLMFCHQSSTGARATGADGARSLRDNLTSSR